MHGPGFQHWRGQQVLPAGRVQVARARLSGDSREGKGGAVSVGVGQRTQRASKTTSPRRLESEGKSRRINESERGRLDRVDSADPTDTTNSQCAVGPEVGA